MNCSLTEATCLQAIIQIACYVPTKKVMSIKPVNSQCSRQQELASESGVQWVLWNSGPKGWSSALPGFPSPQFPTRPKACSQAIIFYSCGFVP